MADSEKTIQVQIEVGALAGSLRELTGGMEAVRASVGNLTRAVTAGFAAEKGALLGVKTSVDHSGTAITKAVSTVAGTVREGITGVATQLGNLFGTAVEIKRLVTKDPVAEGASFAADATGIFANLKSIFSKAGGSQGGQATTSQNTGPVLRELSAGKNTSSSIFSGANASEAGGAGSGAMGDIANLFSYDTEGMIQSLGSLYAKLQESAAAWREHMAAKLEDHGIDLKMIATNTVDHVKSFGAMIANVAQSTATWIANTAAKVGNTAAQVAMTAATGAWQAICVAATAVTTAFGAAVTFLTSPIGLVIVGITALIAIVILLVENWDTVKAAVLGAWDAIVGALGDAWAWLKNTVIDPLVNGIKGAINGVIGFINGLISGAVDGINGLIKVLNKLQFDIPDWVPVFGGETFGFNLKLLSAPQIPYLAKGAVLPANRPFLAMVGDQRHGTNVEAPLTTIQEAVALVMNDQLSAMMAGFEATAAEVRALRRAVEDIQIGDDTIGQAAQRYNRKMSVVHGGY